MKLCNFFQTHMIIKSTIFFLGISILSGCGSSSQNKSLTYSETEQLKQLASIVVGVKFLKTKCSVTNIPNDSVLMEKALNLGREKGWNVEKYDGNSMGEPSKLFTVVNTVYPQLLKEVEQEQIEDLQMKCDEYNALLSEFKRSVNK